MSAVAAFGAALTLALLPACGKEKVQPNPNELLHCTVTVNINNNPAKIKHNILYLSHTFLINYCKDKHLKKNRE